MTKLFHPYKLQMKKIFTLLFFISSGISLKAQTWTGKINSDWNNPGNWTPAIAHSVVIIPGTDITNWPELSEELSLIRFFMMPGSQIDTKGHLIRVNNPFSQQIKINGATIKNTAPGTKILFQSNTSTLIQNTIFEGDTDIDFKVDDLGNYIDTFIESSNHFKGNVKFIERGSGDSYISNSQSTYYKNIEVERIAPGAYGDSSAPYCSLFSGGAVIKGNLKYKNPFGGELHIGGDIVTTISGTVDITHSGNIYTSNNITFDGAALVKLVGLNNTRIFQDEDKPFIFRNISLEKTGAGALYLEKPLSISGQLSFVGGKVISLNNSPLIFLNNSSTSGASNDCHVIGSVQKIGDDSFIFPIGSGAKLMPISISPPENATDNFSVEFKPFDTAIYNPELRSSSLYKVYDELYWDIKRLSGNSNVTITLGYNTPSGYITNQSALRVAHWNGSQWEDLGNGETSGNLTEGSISTAMQTTNFSPFTLATSDASNPLPVKLVDFAVVKEGLIAAINWRTTQEINSDRFDVEHSNDALIWNKIGEVKATNEAKIFSSYQFIHNDPVAGNNYYRLKMIDNDRSFAYSKIVTLKFSDEKAQLVFYPNPASEKLSVQTPQNTIIDRVTFLNKLGQLVLVPTTANNNIDISKLQTGNYVLRVKLANGSTETHNISISR